MKGSIPAITSKLLLIAILSCYRILAPAPALYGFDITITGKEAGIELTPEYNRAYAQCLTIAASGTLELNGRYTLQGGLSLWQTKTAHELDIAAWLTAKLVRTLPLYMYLAYMFNTLPEYQTRSHTALPLIGYRGTYAGITLGTTLRFSSFFDEPVIFEPIIALEGYVNFYNTRRFRIGLRGSNFNGTTAGNFGAYYLSLNSSIGVTKLISLTNDLELHQAGSAGLALVPYGIAYKAGAVFRW